MASNSYIGAIYMFGGSFVPSPSAYSLCDGKLLSISQNTALFSILGTTYGGDGIQTFGLPNLCSRVPVAQGTGLGLAPVVIGEIGGQENTSVLIPNLPIHSHATVVTMNAAADGRPTTDNPSGAVLDSGGGTNIFAAAPDGSTTMAPGATTTQFSNAGGSLPFDIRNPYLGLTFIIVTQGVFPSRN